MDWSTGLQDRKKRLEESIPPNSKHLWTVVKFVRGVGELPHVQVCARPGIPWDGKGSR